MMQMSVSAEEEFERESETPWLPTGPALANLSRDEYADLMAEVNEIEAEANEQTGH